MFFGVKLRKRLKIIDETHEKTLVKRYDLFFSEDYSRFFL